jgi:hypothetical protein
VTANKPAVLDFDPFAVIPLFRHLRNVNSWVLAIPIGIFLGGIIAGASALSGAFGHVSDFQPVQDLQRLFDVGHPQPAHPAFPLIRDVTSWYLALVVVATCVIVHRQWQLMARCLSGLAEDGVLRPKSSITFTRRSRALQVHRYVDATKPADALNDFITRINEVLAARIARWAPVIAGVAAFLVLSLIIADKESLFHVLTPRGFSLSQQQQWLSKAYATWWAGIDHPLGLIAYFLGAFIGAYIIVMQNLIGVASVYVILALPDLADFDADWLNRDGHYGWKPVVRVFRTVYASLSLHGLTISILLVVLGLQSFPWIAGLVAIWIVVVPLYIAIPWRLFRHIESQTKQRRVDDLAALLGADSLQQPLNLSQARVVALEIERTRRARIRPVQVLVPELSTFGVAVLLPLVLTVAQILFSVRFGAGRPGV